MSERYKVEYEGNQFIDDGSHSSICVNSLMDPEDQARVIELVRLANLGASMEANTVTATVQAQTLPMDNTQPFASIISWTPKTNESNTPTVQDQPLKPDALAAIAAELGRQSEWMRKYHEIHVERRDWDAEQMEWNRFLRQAAIEKAAAKVEAETNTVQDQTLKPDAIVAAMNDIVTELRRQTELSQKIFLIAGEVVRNQPAPSPPSVGSPPAAGQSTTS